MTSVSRSPAYRLRTWRGFLKLHGLPLERKNVHFLEFDISEIPGRVALPETYLDPANEYRFENHPLGVAIYSGKVNDILRRRASSIRLLEENTPFDVFDKDCESVPRWVKDVSPCLLRQAFRENRSLFNGEKVRLVSDLLLPSLEGEAPVLAVQKTDYFSSLCTNEAVLRRVFLREKPDYPVLKEFRSLYPADDVSGPPAVLATLRESPCSNHIGVSTIGITEDGHIVWNRQPGSSAQSANRIAPAGSGSADYADLRNGDTLPGFLIRAMERELREECGVARDIPIRTEIIGYARLLHRGGKPEFFGVSTIGCAMNDPVASESASLVEEIDALRKSMGGAFSFLMHLNATFLERHLKRGR